MINWIFDLDLTLYELNGPFSYANMRIPKNLRQQLLQLQGRRVMFTNGNLYHSLQCIKLFNLSRVFHKVLCRELTDLKPAINSYIKAYHYAKMNTKDKCIFFEDTLVNLVMAKNFNWITVLIKKNPSQYEKSSKKVDYYFDNINDALNFFLQQQLNNTKK